jgi:hypothetical protein
MSPEKLLNVATKNCATLQNTTAQHRKTKLLNTGKKGHRMMALSLLN